MDTKELLKKVRKIEIKTRRLSDHIFSGEYHSSFKGRGMTFSEVRQYQYGDDIRSIDWNVTARYNEPYVKIFEEESHQTSESLIEIKRALSEEERCLPRLRPALKTWMRKFQMREKYETFTLTDLFKSLG